MIEKVKEILKDEVEKLEVSISNVNYIKGNPNTLEIEIDSSDVINIDKIVAVTKVISPILDKFDLIKEEYILDVYSKPKGEVISE